MASVPDAHVPGWRASDVVEHFGDIPIARIRTSPPPGESTEADVVELHDHHRRLCELIDGTLVEKAMGWQEALLAASITTILNSFVEPRDLGVVFGADGMFRLAPGQVRIPDVAFVSKERYSGRDVSPAAFWELGCDLAVEVVSPSNTPREMERKLADYFAAGVGAVWLVYPEAREVAVYSSANESATLRGDDMLDGGGVLSGFSAPVSQIFAKLDAMGG